MDLLVEVENTRRPTHTHLQITHSNLIHPPSLGQAQIPVPIQIDNQKPSYVPVDPNYKLDLCCRKQQVSPVCQAMCNYDTFTDRSVSNIFIVPFFHSIFSF